MTVLRVKHHPYISWLCFLKVLKFSLRTFQPSTLFDMKFFVCPEKSFECVCIFSWQKNFTHETAFLCRCKDQPITCEPAGENVGWNSQVFGLSPHRLFENVPFLFLMATLSFTFLLCSKVPDHTTAKFPVTEGKQWANQVEIKTHFQKNCSKCLPCPMYLSMQILWGSTQLCLTSFAKLFVSFWVKFSRVSSEFVCSDGPGKPSDLLLFLWHVLQNIEVLHQK